MRNFLIAAAMVTGVGVCTGAFAADYTSSSPKTTAYLNFGFGGHGKHSDILSSLHYGLRMDQNNPYASQFSGQPARPAFMQADFNLRDGFSGAMVNGVRFASHVKSFDEDGSETSYSMMDWGLLAIGVAGLGFGIAEVLKTKDDPEPKSSTQTVNGTDASGNPIQIVLTTVNGVVTGAVNAATGAGIPIGQLGTIVPTLCGTLGVTCMTGASSYEHALAAQEVDVQRLQWLDSGTGQMGDLIRVR